MKKRNTSDDTMDMDVQRYKEERRKNVKEEEKDMQEVLSRVRVKRSSGVTSVGLEDDDDGEIPRTDDPSGDDLMNVIYLTIHILFV